MSLVTGILFNKLVTHGLVADGSLITFAEAKALVEKYQPGEELYNEFAELMQNEPVLAKEEVVSSLSKMSIEEKEKVEEKERVEEKVEEKNADAELLVCTDNKSLFRYKDIIKNSAVPGSVRTLLNKVKDAFAKGTPSSLVDQHFTSEDINTRIIYCDESDEEIVLTAIQLSDMYGGQARIVYYVFRTKKHSRTEKSLLARHVGSKKFDFEDLINDMIKNKDLTFTRSVKAMAASIPGWTC